MLYCNNDYVSYVTVLNQHNWSYIVKGLRKLENQYLYITILFLQATYVYTIDSKNHILFCLYFNLLLN